MKRIRRSQLLFADWLLLNAALVGMKSLVASAGGPSYFKLMLFVNFLWFVVGYFEKKSRRILEGRLYQRVFFALKNAVYIGYVLAVVFVLFSVTGFSRTYLLGVFLIYGASVSLLLMLDQLLSRRSTEGGEPLSKPILPNWRLFLSDFFLLCVSFLLIHFFKYGNLIIAAKEQEVLLILSAVWLITAIFTEKFRAFEERNFSYVFSPFLKAGIIAAGLLSLVVYGLRLFRYSRTLIFGTLLLLLVFEAALILGLWIRRRLKLDNSDVETTNGVHQFLEKHEPLVEKDDEATPVVIPAAKVLKEQGLAEWPEVFNLLAQHIDLNSIDLSLTRVLYSSSSDVLSLLKPGSLRLFINLQKVGEIPKPNEYFLEVHSKLKSGGYFLVRKDRLENVHERLEAAFPPFIAAALYLFHFFWHRMCPKLPVLEQIYRAFSRGRLKVMTRAEIMGRLAFCGFRHIAFEHIGDSHWFLVQKSTLPAVANNPSHGMLIGLRRIGYRGRIFRLYKLRTMHPYAEFLQEYVHQNNALDESGKFKDDFRLTQWGKVLRRWWIDELPQIINYLRGDIRLFGVRAVSEHYFRLYPEDVQKLRTMFKPGLVPPYYADMPKNFEEIVESERRYLTAKMSAPFKTDLYYFGRAIYNILIKHARSR